MQEEDNINRLIDKYLSGKITPAEEAELNKWYAELHTPPATGHTAPDQVERARLGEKIYAAVAANIATQQPVPVRIMSRRLWWRIAAAIIPAAVVTAGVVYNQKIKKPAVAKLLDLYTHEGGLSKITLTDSSVVWLNANSHLRYPEKFTDSRTVYLEGEAWFDVHQDPAHPFIIESHGYRTRVLGTTFSIRSYPAPNTYKVTVASGKVVVYPAADSNHAVLLTANQEVRIDGDAGTQQVRTVHAAALMSWREGGFSFEKDQLAEVVIALQNRYGVKFRFIQPNLRQMEISGQFDHGQSLKDILNILSKVYNLHFKQLTDNTINIS